MEPGAGVSAPFLLGLSASLPDAGDPLRHRFFESRPSARAAAGRAGSSGQPQRVEPAPQARVAGVPHHDRDVAVAVEHGPAAQRDEEFGRRLDAAAQKERALRGSPERAASSA